MIHNEYNKLKIKWISSNAVIYFDTNQSLISITERVKSILTIIALSENLHWSHWIKL